MDYKKKYKQLYTLINDLYPFMSKYCKEKVEGFFPELRELEDEKIRKSLIILLQHFCKGYRVPGLEFPVSYKDVLVWLEKQGEQKSVDIGEPKCDESETKVFDARENLALDGDLMQADCMMVESNHAWSEEDEKMVDSILTPLATRYPFDIYQPMYNWLKSLKQRIGG